MIQGGNIPAYAPVAELADAPVLGTGPSGYGFKPLQVHQKYVGILYLPCRMPALFLRNPFIYKVFAVFMSAVKKQTANMSMKTCILPTNVI